MTEEITLESLKQEIRREGTRKTANAHKNFPLPTRLLKDLYEQEPEAIDLQFIASYPTSPSLLIEKIAENVQDEEILSRIALNPRTPQLVLNRLSHNAQPNIRLAIAGNRLLSARDFESLIQDPIEFVRRALSTNPGLKGHQQAQLAKDPAPSVRMALLKNKSLELPILIQLSQDESILVRTYVVAQAKVDDAILIHWANSNIEEVQLALFSRKNCPDSIYKLLKFSPHSSVRKIALTKITVQEEEFLWLSESESLEDRMCLLESPNLPRAIQRLLAQDPSSSVRIKLSLHPGIDPKLAREIASNGEIRTCLALTNNPAIDKKVLEILSRNENIEVIKRILYRDDLRLENIETVLLNHSDEILWDHLAIQELRLNKTPKALANIWIKSPKASIRAMGAQALCLSDSQIENLTNDPSYLVRTGVAKNPNIPPKLLIQLEEDIHPEVVEAVKTSMQQLNKISQKNSILLKNSDKQENHSQADNKPVPRKSKKRSSFLNQIKALILD